MQGNDETDTEHVQHILKGNDELLTNRQHEKGQRDRGDEHAVPNKDVLTNGYFLTQNSGESPNENNDVENDLETEIGLHAANVLEFEDLKSEY